MSRGWKRVPNTAGAGGVWVLVKRAIVNAVFVFLDERDCIRRAGTDHLIEFREIKDRPRFVARADVVIERVTAHARKAARAKRRGGSIIGTFVNRGVGSISADLAELAVDQIPSVGVLGIVLGVIHPAADPVVERGAFAAL